MHKKCKKYNPKKEGQNMEQRALTPAAREARNAYRRKWARENPDRIREQQRRYWEKKAAAAAAEDPEETEPELQTAGAKPT